MLLARFFKVHPGYLVDDPEGFHTELMSDVRVGEDQLDLWLISGAERFSRDPEVSRALLSLAKHEDSRKCLLLIESILDTPELADRLFEVLRPEPHAQPYGGKPYELGNILLLLLLCRLFVQPGLVPGRHRRICIFTCREACTATHRHAGARGKGSQTSPINFGTVAAFLAWFGGTGYFLSRYSSIWALLALGLAFVSGLGGAAAVFWFLFKVCCRTNGTWIRRITRWSACWAA